MLLLLSQDQHAQGWRVPEAPCHSAEAAHLPRLAGAHAQAVLKIYTESKRSPLAWSWHNPCKSCFDVLSLQAAASFMLCAAAYLAAATAIALGIAVALINVILVLSVLGGGLFGERCQVR